MDSRNNERPPMARPQQPSPDTVDKRLPMAHQKPGLSRRIQIGLTKLGLVTAVAAGGAGAVHHVDPNIELGGPIPIGATADNIGSTVVELGTNIVVKPAVDLTVSLVGKGNEIVQGISREYKPTGFYSGDGVFNFSNAIFTTSKGEASGPSVPNGFDKNQIVEINGLPISDTVIQNGLLLEHPAFSHYDLNGKDYLIFKARTNYYPGEITLYVDPANPQYNDAKVLSLAPGGKIEDITYYTETPQIRLGDKDLTLDQINIAKPPPTPQPKAP